MSHENIIRAWKDEDYRNSLSKEEHGHIPDHPSGMVEVSNEDMARVKGGANDAMNPQTNIISFWTHGYCGPWKLCQLL